MFVFIYYNLLEKYFINIYNYNFFKDIVIKTYYVSLILLTDKNTGFWFLIA